MENIELFDKVCKLLKSNHLLSFADECIYHVENETVIFEKGKIMATDLELRDIKTHLAIQNEVTHAKVDGYSELINNFNGYIEPKVRECVITTETHSYIIICNLTASLLIGILRSPFSNVSTASKIFAEYAAKGFIVDRLKYFKAQLQKW